MAIQEKNCYLYVGGKKQGPFSAQDIQTLFAQKKITCDTKFARIGMKEWIPLSKSGIITPSATGKGVAAQLSDIGKNIANKSPADIATTIANKIPEDTRKQLLNAGKSIANTTPSDIGSAVASKIPKNKRKRGLLAIAVIATALIVVIIAVSPSGGGDRILGNNGYGDAEQNEIKVNKKDTPEIISAKNLIGRGTREHDAGIYMRISYLSYDNGDYKQGYEYAEKCFASSSDISYPSTLISKAPNSQEKKKLKGLAIQYFDHDQGFMMTVDLL